MSKDLTQKLNGSLEDKIDRLIAVVQSLDSRQSALETKLEDRLKDTRPMWEAVHAQLSEIRESQRGVREEMRGVREEMQGVREEMQSVREEMQSVREEMQSVREDVQSIRADLKTFQAETEKGFRTIDRRMERQIGEFERLHAYQRDLEDRVDKIERPLSQ